MGTADGIGRDARFSSSHGIAVDGTGNLYVADFLNQAIRKGVPLQQYPATDAAGTYNGLVLAERIRAVVSPLRRLLLAHSGVTVFIARDE